MRIIGLTGGVGTGKSSVTRYLRTQGVTVIDCDELARSCVEPGRPELRRIAAEFGPSVLNENGTLNRATLGEIVFREQRARMKLNAIMHPAIKLELLAAVVEAWLRASPIVVVDAPLLVETGLHRYVSEVVVVYCPPEIQVERVCRRDSINHESAAQRIQAQDPIDNKLRLATYVIDNSGTLAELHAQSDEVLKKVTPTVWHTALWLLLPITAFVAICIGVTYALLRVYWTLFD